MLHVEAETGFSVHLLQTPFRQIVSSRLGIILSRMGYGRVISQLHEQGNTLNVWSSSSHWEHGSAGVGFTRSTPDGVLSGSISYQLSDGWRNDIAEVDYRLGAETLFKRRYYSFRFFGIYPIDSFALRDIKRTVNHFLRLHGKPFPKDIMREQKSRATNERDVKEARLDKYR